MVEHGGGPPDGEAFTNFLTKLNDTVFGAAATAGDVTGCFAGHCDWRLPSIVELMTIPDCGFGNPCIDPIFGPTASDAYWSAATVAGDPTFAWLASFLGGNAFIFVFRVRAVRAGSCH